MLDGGLHTMRHVESVQGVLVDPGVTCMQDGVFVDCRCVADWVGVTHQVMSTRAQLLSDNEVVEF
jgi:hypothetical protein